MFKTYEVFKKLRKSGYLAYGRCYHRTPAKSSVAYPKQFQEIRFKPSIPWKPQTSATLYFYKP